MNIIRFTLIAIWTITSILLATIVVLITVQRQLAVRMAYSLWSPVILKIAGVKLIIEGLENINKSKSHIFVANHQSFIDIPILFRAIPVNLHFVAKKEIKKMPFIGWFMMLTGMIFIDRSNRQKAYTSIKKAGEMIKRGKNVLTYPEGTRSKNGKMGLFKKGSFIIATDNGIPIMPIAIINAEKIWPTGTNKLTPGTVTVRIGKPIEVTNEDDPIKIANLAQKKVSELRGY